MAPRRSRAGLSPASLRAGDLAIDPAGLTEAEVARMLDARDRVLARRGLGTDDEAIDRKSVMLVRIGEARFGLPIEAVAAIVPLGRAAPVPGAPPQLLGLFAHDGAIHNLFAVEAALGLPPAEPRATGAALVLRRPGARIAIRIDEAIDVARIAASGYAAADDGAVSRFVAGEGAEAIVLVDVERLVAALGVTGVAMPEGGMR